MGIMHAYKPELEMGVRMVGHTLAIATLLGISELPAAAAPITYQFFQTSTSSPNFQVTAFITVDDDLSDLPTLSSSSFLFMPGAPIDFGNLSAFYFVPSQSPFAFPTTLGNFVAPYYFQTFPEWSISPAQISYNNSMFDFRFSLGPAGASVSYNHDVNPCGFGIRCVATGDFLPVSDLPDDALPVPDLPSGALLLNGLAVLVLVRWMAGFRAGLVKR